VCHSRRRLRLPKVYPEGLGSPPPLAPTVTPAKGQGLGASGLGSFYLRASQGRRCSQRHSLPLPRPRTRLSRRARCRKNSAACDTPAWRLLWRYALRSLPLTPIMPEHADKKRGPKPPQVQRASKVGRRYSTRAQKDARARFGSIVPNLRQTGASPMRQPIRRFAFSAAVKSGTNAHSGAPN
jgi:hypothetical protein